MLKILPPRDSLGHGGPLWFDLVDPTQEEWDEVTSQMDADLPPRETLEEIETSSRLIFRKDILSISIPMTSRDENDRPQTMPVGFVLSKDRLATIRFVDVEAFDRVSGKFEQPDAVPPSSLALLVDLFDEIVDVVADSLEAIAAEMRKVSTATFHVADDQGRRAVRSNKMIRARLRKIGRMGDHLSEIRDTLLNIGRAISFACEMTSGWDRNGSEARMKALKQDVASLDDYQIHLFDKTQFLLDAMVGLIGIAQNDIFKILTIVSIVGIPPTLVAGIYGMNFKFMPELGWTLGYPFGLAVIAFSAIIPLAWFKWRGWF